MMTRCPDCSTAFLVSPTQIKVRAGIVRCGACSTVFNALNTLVSEPVISSTTVKWSREEPDVEPQPATENAFVTSFETGDSVIPAETDAILNEILRNNTGNYAGDMGADAGLELVVDEEYKPEPETGPALTDYLAAPPLPEVALATRHWPWALASTIAVLILLVQATYYYRVELRVLRPELQPLLQAMCAPFHCDVPRPRQIDTLSIDTSDLRPSQHSGHLALTATLRSKASFAQEWPLLELTLTDVNDHKLAVRHFSPIDYLTKDKTLNNALTSGFPANGEISINLMLNIGDLAAAGYRLYIFYP
jgi:predicted Zn finger-like uncharacterized protein